MTYRKILKRQKAIKKHHKNTSYWLFHSTNIKKTFPPILLILKTRAYLYKLNAFKILIK